MAKFGKCLMVVIAVMPAAGLMVSIGNSIPLISPESELLIRIGNIIAQIGWGLSETFTCSLPWLSVEAGLRKRLVVPSQQVLPSSLLT